MPTTAPSVVLITGVSRGLGRAMTARFADLGWTVWGCCRSATAVRELQARFPPPHRFAAVDVAQATSVAAWGVDLLAAGHAPDLLVNNAAIVNETAPLWEVSPCDFSDVVDVNLKGVFHVLRTFVPPMIARGRGIIVNFSSGWGRSTSPEVAPYCATKWGIEGLTSALASELPGGLAAIALNPGIIDTDMLRSCFGADASKYDNADEWSGRAVPFLLSLTARDNGKSLDVP